MTLLLIGVGVGVVVLIVLLALGLARAAGRTSRALEAEEWQRQVREIREVGR